MTTPAAVVSPTTFPRSACYLDPVAVKFAADAPGGDAKAARRFSMNPLLSGSPIQSGYWGTLLIDLSGVQELSRPIPALLNHDGQQRAGVVESLKLEATGIVAEGRLIDSEVAKGIQADAAGGFPWQASAHVQPISLEEVQPGQKAMVNGQEVTGPATIIRASTIREASFVAVGADPDTAAAVLSSRAASSPGRSPMTTPTAPTAPNSPAATPAAATPVQASATPPAVASAATPPVQAAAPAPAPAPATPPVQAAADPVALERARVAAILGAALPEQNALAGALIASGAPLEQALQQINADLRTRFAAQGAATLGALPTATPAPAPGATPAVPAGASDEVRLTAEFNADPKLRAEFAAAADYVAFKRAESAGQIRRIAPAAV